MIKKLLLAGLFALFPIISGAVVYVQTTAGGAVGVHLGRWTGGVQTQGNLPETWTAPTSLVSTEARNDSSKYTWTASTSTLTLPSSGLADGYLITGYYKYEDTSNSRFSPQCRWTQASGTGTFASGWGSGFSRNTTEDFSYVRCWGFVDGPSASGTYQMEWKAGLDDATGGTDYSVVDVISLYYDDVGVYTSTNTSSDGTTTPTQVTGFTGTDGTNITISASTVTVTADNKRFLVLGGAWWDSGVTTRTLRWVGLTVGGTDLDSVKGVKYYRDTNNDEHGSSFGHLIETATASVAIELYQYRGAGITNGDGGAEIAAFTTATAGSHSLVVIELKSGAEVINTEVITQSVDLTTATPPHDLDVSEVSGVNFNDSASFTRATDSTINAEQTMDALIISNISTASEDVLATTRWTAEGNVTVNGTEDEALGHGNIVRHDVAGEGTFGWSANIIGFVALTSGDDLGASVTELTGTSGAGKAAVQPNWAGFSAINLDTLE